MNYNNKKFKAVRNTANGETSSETIFNYQQTGSILTASYRGGSIVRGQLIGLVDNQGGIEMRYRHMNQQGELLTGKCTSQPEIMENGKIRLLETWQWTSGDLSKGNSILEEI